MQKKINKCINKLIRAKIHKSQRQRRRQRRACSCSNYAGQHHLQQGRQIVAPLAFAQLVSATVAHPFWPSGWQHAACNTFGQRPFPTPSPARATAAAEATPRTTATQATRTLATRRCKCAHNLKTFAAAATGNCKWQKLTLHNFADAFRGAASSPAQPCPRHETKTCRGHSKDRAARRGGAWRGGSRERAADALKSLQPFKIPFH